MFSSIDTIQILLPFKSLQRSLGIYCDVLQGFTVICRRAAACGKFRQQPVASSLHLLPASWASLLLQKNCLKFIHTKERAANRTSRIPIKSSKAQILHRQAWNAVHCLSASVPLYHSQAKYNEALDLTTEGASQQRAVYFANSAAVRLKLEVSGPPFLHLMPSV